MEEKLYKLKLFFDRFKHYRARLAYIPSHKKRKSSVEVRECLKLNLFKVQFLIMKYLKLKNLSPSLKLLSSKINSERI
jgi:hypothetical protein